MSARRTREKRLLHNTAPGARLKGTRNRPSALDRRRRALISNLPSSQAGKLRPAAKFLGPRERQLPLDIIGNESRRLARPAPAPRSLKLARLRRKVARRSAQGRVCKDSPPVSRLSWMYQPTGSKNHVDGSARIPSARSASGPLNKNTGPINF
jgi:hypothetical protein